jgi:hypothetical protein
MFIFVVKTFLQQNEAFSAVALRPNWLFCDQRPLSPWRYAVLSKLPKSINHQHTGNNMGVRNMDHYTHKHTVLIRFVAFNSLISWCDYFAICAHDACPHSRTLWIAAITGFSDRTLWCIDVLIADLVVSGVALITAFVNGTNHKSIKVIAWREQMYKGF